MGFYQYIPLILTSVILLIFLAIIGLLYNQNKKARRLDREFMEQLEIASGLSDADYLESKRKSSEESNLFYKWNKYWGRTLIYSDLLKFNLTDAQCGQLVIVFSLVIYLLFTIMFKNFGIGLIPVITALGFISMIAGSRIKSKEKIFEDQIPAFLSILKANIQANETPERALIDAIENTSDPLYSELSIAKALTEAGTFRDAISKMRKNSKNDTLKFLCSCIELSSQVGANLETQINTIEEILESNRALKRKLDVAISENKPVITVTSALMPGIFMFMYIFNEQTRDFWFHSLASWVVFFCAIIIFGAGVLITNRIINKTSQF